MTPENQRKRRRLRVGLQIATAAMLVSLAVLIYGTVRHADQSERSAKELARQGELNAGLRKMQSILIAIGDAETGQRGYLLTGKPLYLRPYTEAVTAIPALLKELQTIPIADRRFQDHLQIAASAISFKLAELDATIKWHDAGRHDAALKVVNTDSGQRYMATIRDELRAAMVAVRADRDAATATLAQANERTRQANVWSVTALAVCLLTAMAVILMLNAAQSSYARDLAASGARHRKIVEDQQELISLARLDGRLTYVNPAYGRHFRKDSSALLGLSLYDLVAPADHQAVRDVIKKVMETGEPASSEIRMVGSDGTEQWVAWTHSLQQEQGTRLLHSVGRDVTERKHAETARRASEDFLARTGRVAGVGGWELDIPTGHLFWSEQVRRIHAVPPDFVPTVEAGIAFYVAGAARDRISQAVNLAREKGEPFDLELPLINAVGRHLFVRAVGEAELDSNGKPVRLIGAFQDITQRKALEDRLASRERFLREITDALPVRMAYLDASQRYTFVNAAHLRRFGRPREAILGRTRAELMPGPPDPRVQAGIEGALQGQVQRIEFDEVLEGQIRVIESRMIPDVGADGQVKGVFSTGVDITDLKTTERRLLELNEILEHTPDFIVQTDWKGRVQYLNPAVRTRLGLGRDEPIAERLFTEFNTPETNERFVNEISPALRRDGVWIGETTVLAEGNTVVPVSHMLIAHHEPGGRIARYSAVMRDISQIVAARKELQRQTATLGAVLEAIPASVAVFDDQFRFRLVNHAFERAADKLRGEVLGLPVAAVFGQAEHDRSWPWAQRALAGETVSYEKDYTDRRQRHMSFSYVPLRQADGTVTGMVSVVQDITLQREEEKRLLNLAERDALTGALNRGGFNRYLQTRYQRDGAGLALLYIDLDSFKPVNDTYGHPVGDELLRVFTSRLQGLVRPTDAVARLGGDEFAVVLNDIRSQADADAVADKVLQSAAQVFRIGQLKIQVGASVGVAFESSFSRDWEDLIHRADAAVYKAKAAGRGRKA